LIRERSGGTFSFTCRGVHAGVRALTARVCLDAVQAGHETVVRSFIADRGAPIEIVPDTESMSEAPQRALLPGEGARLAGPTFDEWLSSEDAAALPPL
jgi:hypothetical protein